MKCTTPKTDLIVLGMPARLPSFRRFRDTAICLSLSFTTVVSAVSVCQGSIHVSQESAASHRSVSVTTAGKQEKATEEKVVEIPNLPRAITSFGAARIGDTVYAYGGNIDTPHDYYKGCQSGQLLKLDTTKMDLGWEVVSEDDQLQGVALCSHGKFLYRIGGFTATNEKGEPQSLHSLDTVKRFDTTKKQWETLTPLPAGRSSLDAFVVGDLLYVVGGWDMNGDEDTVWHDDVLVGDLSAAELEWKPIVKPGFERRAIAVATHGKWLMVAGGMNSDEETTTEVNFYNPENETWSTGPDLPGKSMDGFGAAANTVDGRAVVSMMSGKTFILDQDATEWTEVSSSDSPRFFHRLIPFGSRLMAIGGTSMKTGKYDTNEWIETKTSAK